MRVALVCAPLLLVGGCLGFLLIEGAGQTEAAEAFLEAANTGDADATDATLDPVCFDADERDRLRAAIRTFSFERITTIRSSVVEVSNSGTRGEVVGEVETAEGQRIAFDLTMRKDDGWRVCGVSLRPIIGGS